MRKEMFQETVDGGKDEEAVAGWESEGGFVPRQEQAESGDREETFIGRAKKYCRMVGGKLMCTIGEHEYVETVSEIFHGGMDKKIHLRCERRGCGKKAWTEWKFEEESGEYKRIL